MPASARAGCWCRAAGRGLDRRIASSSTAAASTSRPGCRSVRPGRPPPPALRRRSFDVVFSAFGALQFVADADRRWSQTSPGCCARVASSRSPSPTRPGGCSRTTRARTDWSPRSPTGTGRRTSRWTTSPGDALRRAPPHPRRLGRGAGGAWLRADRPARARVAGGPRPHLGRVEPDPRPAHPRYGDLRAPAFEGGTRAATWARPDEPGARPSGAGARSARALTVVSRRDRRTRRSPPASRQGAADEADERHRAGDQVELALLSSAESTLAATCSSVKPSCRSSTVDRPRGPRLCWVWLTIAPVRGSTQMSCPGE